MILAPGATAVTVHPAWTFAAQMTILARSGWHTIFVHCGPAAPYPRRPHR